MWIDKVTLKAINLLGTIQKITMLTKAHQLDGKNTTPTRITTENTVTVQNNEDFGLPKKTALAMGCQIRLIALEYGFVFNTTWKDSYSPEAEFYRLDGHPPKPKTRGEDKGKENKRRKFTQGNNEPDAMLVFQNLQTLQKSYRFLLRSGKHKTLLLSHSKFQNRVQSNALPLHILEKAKALDEAWELVMNIWRKRHSPGGPEITEAICQSKEYQALDHSISSQPQNEEMQDVPRNAETVEVCTSLRNIKEIMTEVSMSELISPLPPTPEVDVSRSEEDSGQWYSLLQNSDTETNAKMENSVQDFDLNMLN